MDCFPYFLLTSDQKWKMTNVNTEKNPLLEDMSILKNKSSSRTDSIRLKGPMKHAVLGQRELHRRHGRIYPEVS